MMFPIAPLSPSIDWGNPLTKGLIFDPDYGVKGGAQAIDIVKKDIGTFLGVTKPAFTLNRLGPGLIFNGTTSYIDFTETTDLDIAGSAITVETWVILTALSGQIVCKPHASAAHTSPYFSYAIMSLSANSKARIWITTSGNSGGVASGEGGPNVAINTLYHFVGTYNGSLLKFYINGVQADSVSASGTISSFATPLRMGANGELSEVMNGILFKSRVYNIAKTANEVKALFQEPMGFYKYRRRSSGIYAPL